MRKSIRALVVALAATLILPAAVFAYWPVATTGSYVSQWFSSRHPAEDIASYAGTRVVPIRSGKVVFAGWRNNCGGYQVWISHGNGLYSAYYHLRNVYAWRGEAVSAQSTTIGRVGMSGCATGPHLHFEVWHGYPWASGSYRIRPWGYIDAGAYLPYRYR
ncbi:MAG TPA: M23 family metallopeptidase [Candidatus Dormibacteraeota bacterium]|nr:M23 family metallopeptidase [Candidatus Dormibacteraeota bacterium]